MKNRLCFDIMGLTKTERPIFPALINHIKTMCLLDTGSILPVYCGGKPSFDAWTSHVKNVTIVGELTIRGFGYTKVEATVYNIPEFCLSNGTNSITYKNVRVAQVASPDSVPQDIILPATMFLNMRYAFDTVTRPSKVIIEPTHDPVIVRYDNESNGVYVQLQDSIATKELEQ